MPAADLQIPALLCVSPGALRSFWTFARSFPELWWQLLQAMHMRCALLTRRGMLSTALLHAYSVLVVMHAAMRTLCQMLQMKPSNLMLRAGWSGI